MPSLLVTPSSRQSQDSVLLDHEALSHCVALIATAIDVVLIDNAFLVSKKVPLLEEPLKLR